MTSETNVAVPRVLDDLDVGILLHHPEDARILGVNAETERIYGYDRTTLATMTIDEFSADSNSFTQEEAVDRVRAAADGDPQTFEWQIKRANGERRWVEVHLRATTIDDVDVVLAEVRDVTAYRARERRLHLLSRVIRHNLRNDMTILEGHAQRLKDALEHDTLEDDVDVILDIATEVGTLSESIGQIEEIVEPEATKRETRDLAEIVASVVADARRTYDAEFVLGTIESAFVVADRGVEYALRQALDNAVEHADDDARPITVTVSVETDADDERGVVRVADQNPPIPDVETDVLDEEVEQTSTYHGSGVGLWVMKWCVESLGGNLSFAANDPRGNVVSLALPRTTPVEDLPGDD